MNEALAFFENRQPRPTWREVANEILAPNAPEVIRNEDVIPTVVIGAYYRANRGINDPFWWVGGRTLAVGYEMWVRGGRVGPEPNVVVPPLPPVIPGHVPQAQPAVAPPRPAPVGDGLDALAYDSQNVHRAVVARQTNANMDLILATPDVPNNVRSHELLAMEWLAMRVAPWTQVRRVVDDIYAWRAKDTCRMLNDQLYRRLINALVMRVRRMTNVELRTEVTRRIYEECEEAVGYCCEGHISRLCNVLVGFDDAFKPPVPFGEILQAKMAAIAGMDIELDGKVKLAMEFFDEHKVPQEERMAWLDAF
jgi:hypothetical protein